MRRRSKKRSTKIEIDNADAALKIDWNDGTVSSVSLVQLRKGCPCAVCRESRGQSEVEEGQLRLLDADSATATAEASGYVNVGRYGIRITWADGHDTGIYTFESLREEAASEPT